MRTMGNFRCSGALVALLAIALPATASQFEPVDSAPAARFDLVDLHDAHHTLADYRGEVVLVNFWASWCAQCVYEMPGLAMLQQRHADQPFAVMTIDAGEKKDQVRRVVELADFTLPVLLDTDRRVFGAWGVENLPTSFLVDADGRIRYRLVGGTDWDGTELDTLIDSLLPDAGRRSAP